MEKLKAIINSISSVDRSLEKEIQFHIDNLTKPPGSLGKLEEIALTYCLIFNTLQPQWGKKRLFVFAADHGVAVEGVSAFPQEVTSQMVRNMAAGGAAINVLARHVGAEAKIIDIGVKDSLEGVSGIIPKKIKPGTNNIAIGPAMAEEEAYQAIEIGIELAQEAYKEGVTLIGTGEMGIANTTSASALFTALLPASAEEVTGYGTGIDEITRLKKIEVIKRALKVNQNHLNHPFSTLAALGGLEIAAICGVILGAASLRIPVVVDGFISSAGVLVAGKLCPQVKDYLFFSHCSDEMGHRIFFERFGAAPLLDLKLRLGEGTGAALAMSLIEAAIKLYNEMATFSGAGVSRKRK